MGATNRDQKVIDKAVEITRKFGFLPRSIVWKHLSRASRSVNYYYWELLQKAPQFSAYKNGFTASKHLTLSTECRKILGDGAYVKGRSMTYFEHDEMLMDFALQLDATELISSYWTEQELKMNRLLTLKTLGGDSGEKMPDLVFDIASTTKPARLALEVERTRKSRDRYRKIYYAYSRLKKLDCVLFGVIDLATEAVIRGEFERYPVTVNSRPYGYFTLSEFSKLGLGCDLRIQGKTLVLGELLASICGRQFTPLHKANENLPENSKTVVRQNLHRAGDDKCE